MARVNVRDFVGGAVICAVGLYFLVGALDMRVGSAMQMGPGYFPMLVGGIVAGLGVIIMLTSLASSARFYAVDWRPMLAVLSAIAGFALILRFFGLIPAMFVAVVIAALGDRTARPRATLALAAVAAIGAWLVFRVGLGLQMPGLKIPAWLG